MRHLTRAVAVFLVPMALACSAAVTPLPATSPDANGVEHRRFRVECIRADQCRNEAAEACGSPFDVVSEWHNTIPESALPGLNEQSRPKDAREWNAMTLPRAGGIESDAPMPLSSIVVVCRG